MNYTDAFKQADEVLNNNKSYNIKGKTLYAAEGMKQAFNTLTKTAAGIIINMPDDYFIKPASMFNHSSEEGGLFRHSYEVARALCEYTEKLGLIWERPESPLIIGLFHDLCKLECYKVARVDDAGGYKIRYFEHNYAAIMPDHGALSVIMAQQLGEGLTGEEIACIRWHMGAYEKDPHMWGYYNNAIKIYPNVLYTHTADMHAAHVKGI